MACSILLLFCMMLFALISIMCSRWKLNKCLGASLLLLYILFVCVSLSFHYDLVKCPL
ncbi:UNVERIFIED_CONTAM: hypothetical protein GTU68_025157 [Idotea baltica]|nr:hypothetical protein [Idotea baltica]